MNIRKRRLLLLLIDCAIFIGTYSFFALYTQSYRVAPALTLAQRVAHCGTLTICIFGMRVFSGIYGQVWRYANTTEYLRLVFADFLGGCLYLAVDRLLMGSHLMAVAAISVVCFSLVASLSARFAYQRLRYLQSMREGGTEGNKISVAVVGAGSLGVSLVKELQSNPHARYKPYCFIDADRSKIGNWICGLKVFRESEDVVEQMKQMPVQEIIIAISSLNPEELNTLYKRYEQTGCKVRIYAHPLEGSDVQETKRRIRDIRIEDLLFRDAITLNEGNLQPLYAGKTILITGGGGSIGSELCRQVAKMRPARLVLVDIYENNAYDIQQELYRIYGDALCVRLEIATVRDAEKMETIFQRYKPSVVFHAAAHKHVHLMEACCDEAVKNNVFGTYNVVQAAERAGVERFIMISTDKAVNPTNMMGATKRLCEMIIQSKWESATRFVAVRFGNVLGSNGSVIPLFKRLIESGGPVTITDKRIIRYFMTIPEAAQLVIQAGAMAEKSEIYVLDMGKPMRILDLAENMIRLAGLEPYRDIDIVEIGLRPGEKLYEELLMKTEELDRTNIEKIFVERDKVITPEELEEKLADLRAALGTEDEAKIRQTMMRIVPTYRNAEEVNRHACDAEEMRQMQEQRAVAG